MSRQEEGLMSPIFGYNVANSWTSSTLEKDQEEQGVWGRGCLAFPSPQADQESQTRVPHTSPWTVVCCHVEGIIMRNTITQGKSLMLGALVFPEMWQGRSDMRSLWHRRGVTCLAPAGRSPRWLELDCSLGPCRLVTAGVLKMSPRLQMMP